MTAIDSEPLEFSFPVDLKQIKKVGARFAFEADASARARIARRLGAPAVDALAGEALVTPNSTGVTVEGQVRASLLRECVVSLEPMAEALDELFLLEFSRNSASLEPGEDEEALDAPEPLDGDILDLGEILVQQLALSMDPYPRKPGASLLNENYGDVAESSPFAALRRKVAQADREE